MIKEFQFPHHRQHGVQYLDRMDTIAREVNEVHYVNHKGNLNTFWIIVLYVKPFDTHN